jgi:hypothetical protein
MRGAGAKSSVAQPSGELIRDHHRSVATAGATDADRNIGLPFSLILRQKVIQEVREPRECLFDFGLILQIFHHPPIGSGK